jgi:hypothetical protein
MSTVNVACGSARRVLGEAPVVCNRERGHVGEHCSDVVGNRTWWPRDVKAEEAVVDGIARLTSASPVVIPGAVSGVRADLDALTVRVAALEAARPAVEELPSVAEVQFRRTADMLRRQVDQLQSELVELERQRDAARATVEVAGALVRKQNEQHERDMREAQARIRALEGSAAERCRAEAELRELRARVAELERAAEISPWDHSCADIAGVDTESGKP